jgi:hypothetical protein
LEAITGQRDSEAPAGSGAPGTWPFSAARRDDESLPRRYRQPQSPGHFGDAEVFQIPQQDDDPLFFPQPGDCGAQPANRTQRGLEPLFGGELLN